MLHMLLIYAFSLITFIVLYLSFISSYMPL